MVLCEDGECSVCLLPFSRTDRIPRVLHCRHTFCEPCLETISRARKGLLTVGCPLCRRVTCVHRGLSLQEALWVNIKLWEQIPEDVKPEVEGEEDGHKQRAEVQRMEAKQRPSLQGQCISSRSASTRLRLPTLFRRFGWAKQHRESIIPGSNVEMKSWRKFSADDIF